MKNTLNYLKNADDKLADTMGEPRADWDQIIEPTCYGCHKPGKYMGSFCTECYAEMNKGMTTVDGAKAVYSSWHPDCYE